MKELHHDQTRILYDPCSVCYDRGPLRLRRIGVSMSNIAKLSLASPALDPAASYRHAVRVIERLEMQLHHLIRIELDKADCEINSVQAFLLYKIGDTELNASEIKLRGLYLGSNSTYNLKKLTELGYLSRSRIHEDKRIARIKLTDKGKKAAGTVSKLIGSLAISSAVSPEDLGQFVSLAERIEHAWAAEIRN